MFANLQLRAVQATDAKHEFLFGDYLGLRLITTTLALLAIIGTAFVSGYRMETTLVIIAVGVAKSFESISDVFYGLLQKHEKMDRIAKSMMIKGPLSLVALGTGVYLTKSTLWGSIGLAVAWMLVLAGYDIRSGLLIQRSSLSISNITSVKVKLRTLLISRWDKSMLIKLTWIALPMGLVMLLISLNTNIPRYFIEHYHGEWNLGIYAAISYLMVAGSMVVSALGQSASPRLAKYYASGEVNKFRDLLLKLVGIGILLGAVGVIIVAVAGKPILLLLYGPEYAKQVVVFVWLMVAAGINYIASFLGYGMTAARYFRVQTPLFAFIACTLAIACLWLVPRYGLMGAALALIIAAAMQMVGSIAIVLHAVRKLQNGSYREG